MKKLQLSFAAALVICSQNLLANELGNIPTVTVPNSVEVRANPQTGQGMRSVPDTMPPVNPVRISQGPQPIGALHQNTQLQNAATAPIAMSQEQRARAKDAAFDAQLEKNFPMTDDQIRKLNGKVENLAKAYRQSTNPVPDYVPGEVTVNFGVNGEMPVIMVGANLIYETSLIFTDATGAPWEVVSYNIPNKEFIATFPSNIKGNHLALQTTAPYGVTSLSVLLKGAPSPLMFQVVTGQPEAYSLFNVKVNSVGPNAPKGTRFANTNMQFNNADEDMKTLLTGIVPKGLKQLSLTGSRIGSDTFAWASRDGKYVYVRSPMKINAPNYIDGGQIGGTSDFVYQLNRTNFISFGYQGRDVTVKIQGLPVQTTK